MKLKAQTPFGWVVRGCLAVVGLGSTAMCLFVGLAVVFAFGASGSNGGITEGVSSTADEKTVLFVAAPTAAPVIAATSLPAPTEPPTPTVLPTTPPTATVIPTPAPPQAEAIQSNVNFRSSAGADQAVAGQLCQGDSIEVTSQQEVDAVLWYQIAIVGRGPGCENTETATGWVRSDFVSAPSSSVETYVVAIGQTLPEPRFIPTATPKPTNVPQPTPQPKQVAPQGQACDPNYSGACIPNVDYDLDCGEISARRFTVVGRDVHRFDRDNDGVACES